MTEEKNSEAKEPKQSRARKTAASKDHEKESQQEGRTLPENESLEAAQVETKPTPADDLQTKESEENAKAKTESDEVENAAYATSKGSALNENPRIIKKGEPIEVDTDDKGYATETVLREEPLMGTDAVTLVLVASKGARYTS